MQERSHTLSPCEPHNNIGMTKGTCTRHDIGAGRRYNSAFLAVLLAFAWQGWSGARCQGAPSEKTSAAVLMLAAAFAPSAFASSGAT